MTSEYRLISPPGIAGSWVDHETLMKQITTSSDLTGWEVETRSILCGASVVDPAILHADPDRVPMQIPEPSIALVWLAGAIAGTFALIMWLVN